MVRWIVEQYGGRIAIMNKHFITFSLTLAVAITGCGPMPVDNSNDNVNGNGSGEPIQLSPGNAKTGEFVVIRHSSIVEGEARMVSFRQLDGTVQQHEVIPHTDGEMSLPVPPVFDPSLDFVTGGAFDVSIDGVNGEENLLSGGPFSFPDVPAGSILPLFIESALEDYDALTARLTSPTDELATAPQRQELLDAIAVNRAFLANLLDELETTGGITVPVSATETRTLAGAELHMVEQLLVSSLVGAHLEMIRRETGAASRVIGADCVSDLRNGNIQAADMQQCIDRCIQDVKDSAIRASQTAGVLPAAIGGVITVVGLGASSGALVVTGLVVATAGVLHGVFTAYAADQNTDSFLARDGQGFSASRETISQTTRLTATVLGNAPGPVGLAFSGTSVLISANDVSNSIEAARCDRNSTSQRVIQVSTEDIVFCSIVEAGGDSGDGGSSGDDPEVGTCEDLGVEICCAGDAFCDEPLFSSCERDPECDKCGADGVCIELGCPQPDPDCEDDTPGEGCSADGECNDACTAADPDPDCDEDCSADGVCNENCSDLDPDPDCDEPDTGSPACTATSTFTSGDEGWTLLGDAEGGRAEPDFNATGGNPGAYVSADDDVAGGIWYWKAPPKFHGDFAAAYGKTLTFDLRQSSLDSQINDQRDVIFSGGGGLIWFDSTNPGTGWTSYSISLSASAGWMLDDNSPASETVIREVLSSLDEIQIRGEYISGPDTGSLDNVVLNSGCP